MGKEPHKIAVIGAGVMGLSASAVLSDIAHIDLYEPQNLPAKNASYIAGGMLAPYAELEHMPRSYIPACLESIEFWNKLQHEQELDLGFSQTGSLVLAHPQDRYIRERLITHIKQPSEARPLNHVDLKALEPQISEQFSDAIFLPHEAYLNPQKASGALCTHIKERGVCFINKKVQPEDLTQKYDSVIDARGYSAAIHQSKLRAVKGELLIVENTEFHLERPVRIMHPRYPLYIVPRGEGLFMIGATIIESADEGISLRSSMELMSALYTLHPSFGEARILDMQSGLRPSYDDNLPRIINDKNIISANGLYRHGWLMAPMMAKIIKDIITGNAHTHQDLFLKQTREGQDDEDYHQRRRENTRSAA